MTKSQIDLDGDTVPSDERALDLVPKIGINAYIRRLMVFAAVAMLGSWVTSNFSNAWRESRPRLGYLEVSEQSQSDGKPGLEARLTEPWNRIQPRRELKYHDCFNGFQCARLDVPMDWNSTDPDGPRVSLAIAKLPARVPVTDARYGGLLYLQSGGPGSSGVSFVLNHGKTVQMIVDSNLDLSDIEHNKSNPPKYYDVLGMDPRGVNNTTPRISCFPTMVSRNIWTLQSDAQGIINSSDSALANMWARYKALGEGCSERIKRSNLPESEIAFHMNTAPLIRDIVEVIEQHGKWREGQALWSLVQLEDERKGESRQETDAITNRMKWRKGKERLLFWGLSYGTIVGTTFAAMQPHRVERAIMDGVVDAPDYYSSEWLRNLQDTDTILDSFCEYCDEAGAEKCALYTVGGKKKIKERFMHIVDALKGDPIGVPARGALTPDLITYSDLKLRIGTAIYAPLQYWSSLAELLVDLEYRNGTSFAMLKQQEQQILTPPPECRDALPYTPSCAIPPDISIQETLIAIHCTDSNFAYGMSRDEFAKYAAKLRNQSWLISEWWATIRLGCVGWDIKPTWRFPGPFAGHTAHPMMFVGNTRDPVTPIRNARAMSARFPGSAVLATEGEGHCVFSAPSLCMAKHVREYFQTGRLPEKGAVCEANEKAFLGITNPGDHDDRKLLEHLTWSASHLFA